MTEAYNEYKNEIAEPYETWRAIAKKAGNKYSKRLEEIRAME
jgi:hypothetical protein